MGHPRRFLLATGIRASGAAAGAAWRHCQRHKLDRSPSTALMAARAQGPGAVPECHSETTLRFVIALSFAGRAGGYPVTEIRTPRA